ncbi:hypothetical protein B0H15DRAFT_815508 [Mycena belliarum]|uniref:Uncharacterized protein n=1 Tax=Mycena belliarum TaxID=1033014 RepID=A0AAD6UF96_9AGAR|nr:hypothetical protein B0H15DRAFT_815508 [Mycena belliae]
MAPQAISSELIGLLNRALKQKIITEEDKKILLPFYHWMVEARKFSATDSTQIIKCHLFCRAVLPNFNDLVKNFNLGCKLPFHPEPVYSGNMGRREFRINFGLMLYFGYCNENQGITRNCKADCDQIRESHLMQWRLQRDSGVGQLEKDSEGREKLRWDSCDCAATDSAYHDVQSPTQGLRMFEWLQLRLFCRMLQSTRISNPAAESIVVKWVENKVRTILLERQGDIRWEYALVDLEPGVSFNALADAWLFMYRSQLKVQAITQMRDACIPRRWIVTRPMASWQEWIDLINSEVRAASVIIVSLLVI